MNTHRLIPSFLAACCLCTGCSGDGEHTDSSSESSATEVSGADGAGVTRDACELLTAAEVAAVHGGPVEARRGDDDGPDRTSCIYAPPGSDWDVMWITVHWRGGREEWQTQQRGREIGNQMMSAEGEDVDSITRPDPLAGIGDAAYYGGILPSLVLEGDVLLEFMMPLLRDDRQHFPVLAQKAVSRL